MNGTWYMVGQCWYLIPCKGGCESQLACLCFQFLRMCLLQCLTCDASPQRAETKSLDPTRWPFALFHHLDSCPGVSLPAPNHPRAALDTVHILYRVNQCLLCWPNDCRTLSKIEGISSLQYPKLTARPCCFRFTWTAFGALAKRARRWDVSNCFRVFLPRFGCWSVWKFCCECPLRYSSAPSTHLLPSTILSQLFAITQIYGV